jgi:hypothetical protein
VKNNVIFGIALLLGFASAHAELTYMDIIKSSIGVNGFYLDKWNGLNRKVDLDIIDINSIPLYTSAVNISLKAFGKKSEQLEKVIQYNAWYNPHHMLHAIDEKGEFVRYNYGNRELFRKALVAEIVEPMIFLSADYGFEKLMGETEAGKTVAQSIPPFWKKNGKIVASAFVARAAGTVAKGESLSENAQAFGKSAFVHIGSDALGEYIINPLIHPQIAKSVGQQLDKFMGPEDSGIKGDIKEGIKEGAKLLVSGAGLYAVHVALNMSLKMLSNSTGSSEKSCSDAYIRVRDGQAAALNEYTNILGPY